MVAVRAATLVALFAVACLGAAVHAPAGSTIESRAAEWKRVDGALDKKRRTVDFTVVHKMAEGLSEHIQQRAQKVWDTNSPTFGQPVDTREITHNPAWIPHNDAVHAWLEQGGIASRCERLWDRHVCKDVPVVDVERQFQVQMANYRHAPTNKRAVYAVSEPTLIDGIAAVYGVQPEDPYPAMRHYSRMRPVDNTTFEPTFILTPEGPKRIREDVAPARVPKRLRHVFAAQAVNCNIPSNLMFVADQTTATRVTLYTLLPCQAGGFVRSTGGSCVPPSQLTIKVRYDSPSGAIANTYTFNLAGASSYSFGQSFSTYANQCAATQSLIFTSAQFTVQQLRRHYVSAFVSWTSGSPRVSTETFYSQFYSGGLGTPFGVVPMTENTPTAMRTSYGISDSQCSSGSSAASNPNIGILALYYQSNGVLMSDFQKYAQTYLGNVYDASRITMVGDCRTVDRGETTLDVEMAQAMCPTARITLFCVANSFSAIQTFFSQQAQSASTSTTTVFSVSYGACEATSSSMATFYRQSDAIHGTMSLAGLQTFIACGDDGAECNAAAPVAVQSGALSNVVSVGATEMVGTSEQVCSTIDGQYITGGGGFSAVIAAPTYQTANGQVRAYRSAATTRGYPDIAAIGTQINVVMNGQVTLMAGTSASAPIAASYIARALYSAGLTRIAALQSLLYNTTLLHRLIPGTSLYRDVTAGNICAGRAASGFPPYMQVWPSASCYAAATGWDATSGFGSVLYQPLLTLLRAIRSGTPSPQTPTTKPATPIPTPAPRPSTPLPTPAPRPPTPRPTPLPTRAPPPTPLPTRAPTRVPTLAPPTPRPPTPLPTRAPTRVPTRGPTPVPQTPRPPTPVPTPAPATTGIVNGGFNLPNVGNSYSYVTPPGWSSEGLVGVSSGQSGMQGNPYSGQFAFLQTANKNGVSTRLSLVSQTVNGLTVGARYNLQFALTCRGGYTCYNLRMTVIIGTVLLVLNFPPPTTTRWGVLTATFTAAQTSPVLTIRIYNLASTTDETLFIDSVTLARA